MKKFIPLLTLALLAALAATGRPAGAVSISINQFVEHPALNAAVRGFKDALADEGFRDAVFSIHIAQADMSAVMGIVSRIQGEKPDLALAVGTPSAQALAREIKDLPVLFTAVTDPEGADLVDSLERPGHNVTGTTDMSPVEAQVALIREIHPQARNLGVIYNAGEANSLVLVGLLKEAAEDYGFEVREALAANTAGVREAARSLAGGVDVIYLPTDSTVVSSQDSIVRLCVENKIPLYTGEADSVRQGAVASLAINYYKLGHQTGVQAARILRGEVKPADLPVETQKDTSLVINLPAAGNMGAVIPKSVLDRAEEIIK
jgi:putative ABC transport system substrate-binding protein